MVEEDLGPFQPAFGREIENAQLGERLLKSKKFSKDEVEALELSELQRDDYIRVREVFFKPVSSKKDADAKVHEKFKEEEGLVDEELAAVKEELSLSGLNFPLLRAKLMRKWRFYLAIVFLGSSSPLPLPHDRAKLPRPRRLDDSGR